MTIRPPRVGPAAIDLPPHFQTPTLAEIIRGDAPARQYPAQTVLYLQHGNFAWDTALAVFTYNWAKEAGIGLEIDL